MEFSHEAEDGVGRFLVTIELEEGAVGVIVADVAVFFGADRSDAVYGFIATVSTGEEVDALAFGVWPQEDAALHLFRFSSSCDVEGGGSPVDGSD